MASTTQKVFHKGDKIVKLSFFGLPWTNSNQEPPLISTKALPQITLEEMNLLTQVAKF